MAYVNLKKRKKQKLLSAVLPAALCAAALLPLGAAYADNAAVKASQPEAAVTARANLSAPSWPLYQQFLNLNYQAGRIIDYSDKRQITTSEGQSYAMFFSLVAGDEKTFDALQRFNEEKLRQPNGLYAWLYGSKEDGTLGVLDANDAADSDLFIAYNLLEAGRLWDRDDYRERGLELCQAIKQLTVKIDNLGALLLPGLQGFDKRDEGYITLNPSYYPYFLLRRLSLEDREFSLLNQNLTRALLRASPSGVVPDWARFNLRGQFIPTPSDTGAYNAIRVYLFSGMILKSDPIYQQLRTHFAPMINAVRSQKAAPSEVAAHELTFRQMGPYYLTAAFLPYLRTDKSAALLRAELYQEGLMKERYYGNVLSLFALGFDEGRYYFDQNGRLVLPERADR